MPIYQESSLIANASKARNKAFEQAFEKYWAQLYHHALRKLNDQEMAEDLIQECFVVLWNNGVMDDEDQLRSYLYGVLRHKILDVFRKEEVHLRYADGFAKIPQSYALAADEHMIANELQKIIDDELALMPPRMVEIYHLKRELKLSVAQIAKQLGISEQTVKNQSHRAAERLKQRILAFDSSLLIFLISILLRTKS